jgi:aminopeptidase 2
VPTDEMFRIIDAAFDMFEKFSKGDQDAIHPNIRGSVYAIVLQNGGVKEVRVRRFFCF